MAVAVLKRRRSDPTSFTVADGTAIPKGTLLTLTDNRTAIQASASGSVFAGICARDKIASDGRTEVGVYTDGIFDILLSGSVSIGQAVISSSASQDSIEPANPTNTGRAILGHALEAGTNAETIEVELNIGGGGIQVT